MSDVHIVAGDLEMLAEDTKELAAQMHETNIEAAFGDAGGAMPGATSVATIITTGETMNQRKSAVSNEYDDFSALVVETVHDHQSNDAMVGDSFRNVQASSDRMQSLASRMEDLEKGDVVSSLEKGDVVSSLEKGDAVSSLDKGDAVSSSDQRDLASRLGQG